MLNSRRTGKQIREQKPRLEPEQDGDGTREENSSVNLFEVDGRRTRRRNYTPPKSDQKFSADYRLEMYKQKALSRSRAKGLSDDRKSSRPIRQPAAGQSGKYSIQTEQHDHLGCF
jgi:hypothetical protein